MNKISKEYRIEIHHAENGGEYQIKSLNGKNLFYKVDGIHICAQHHCEENVKYSCEYNDTIWKIYGDYNHKNPEVYEVYEESIQKHKKDEERVDYSKT